MKTTIDISKMPPPAAARALRDDGLSAKDVAKALNDEEGPNMPLEKVARALYEEDGIGLSVAEVAEVLYDEDGLNFCAEAVAEALKDGLGLSAQEVAEALYDGLSLSTAEVTRACESEFKGLSAKKLNEDLAEVFGRKRYYVVWGASDRPDMNFDWAGDEEFDCLDEAIEAANDEDPSGFDPGPTWVSADVYDKFIDEDQEDAVFENSWYVDPADDRLH